MRINGIRGFACPCGGKRRPSCIGPGDYMSRGSGSHSPLPSWGVALVMCNPNHRGGAGASSSMPSASAMARAVRSPAFSSVGATNGLDPAGLVDTGIDCGLVLRIA